MRDGDRWIAKGLTARAFAFACCSTPLSYWMLMREAEAVVLGGVSLEGAPAMLASMAEARWQAATERADGANTCDRGRGQRGFESP